MSTDKSLCILFLLFLYQSGRQASISSVWYKQDLELRLKEFSSEVFVASVEIAPRYIFFTEYKLQAKKKLSCYVFHNGFNVFFLSTRQSSFDHFHSISCDLIHNFFLCLDTFFCLYFSNIFLLFLILAFSQNCFTFQPISIWKQGYQCIFNHG